MKPGPIPRLTETEKALAQLRDARDNLETVIDFLRSIGHYYAAIEIDDAIEAIKSEIQTLMEDEL